MKQESFGQRFGIQFSTMGPHNTAQGSAAVRFAPYVEELQEFFASACLRYGSPEDIIGITDRIESSQAFADDLSSMIRSIVLREGGQLPHSQMLEILALAIGGEKMDNAPQHFAQPLRNLLSFMTSVLRKPWNEPPGEVLRGDAGPEHPADQPHAPAERMHGPHHPRERGEVVPFPAKPYQNGDRGYGQAAAISAAADRAAQQLGYTERHGPSAPVPINLGSIHRSGVDPLSDPRMNRRVPDPIGEPTAPDRSMFDPSLPADEALDDPDFPDETSDADASTAVTLPLGPSASAAARPAGVQAETSASHSEPAVPEPAAPEPSWKLAAEQVRGTKQIEVPAVPPPAAAAPKATPAAAKPGVDSVPDVDWKFGAAATSVEQHAPKAPVAAQQKPALREDVEPVLPEPPYMLRMPRTPAGILVAGAAFLVLVGILAAEFHRTPTELTGKQAAPSSGTKTADATATAAPVQQAVSEPAAKVGLAAAPVASSPTPTLTRVRRSLPVVDEEEDENERGVAAPYSTPIPGQTPIAKPSPYVPAQPAVASGHEVRPPSNEIASTTPQAGGYPAGHEYTAQPYASGQAPLRPGIVAGYRGSEPALGTEVSRSSRGSRGVTERPDQIEVSPGMMAGYLVSAPKPDYPGLARITHIGGPVVLQAVVAKNGSVLATHVLSGHRLLRGAAEDAVRRWRFRPYVMEGHPVEVSTIVTVRFNSKK